MPLKKRYPLFIIILILLTFIALDLSDITKTSDKILKSNTNLISQNIEGVLLDNSHVKVAKTNTQNNNQNKTNKGNSENNKDKVELNESLLSGGILTDDLFHEKNPEIEGETIPKGRLRKLVSPIISLSSEDPECTSTPNNVDCEITQNLDLEPGHYILTGTMDFQNDNVYLDCHGATLEYPESYALIYVKYFSNITIKNCNLVPAGVALSFKSPDLPGTPANTGEIYLYNNTVQGYGGFYAENVTGMHIDGLSLINLSTKFYGMRFWSVKDVVVENLYSEGYKGNDVQLIWSDNITVKDSEFVDFWRYSAIFLYNTTNSKIEGNHIYQRVPSCIRTYDDNSRIVIVDNTSQPGYNNSVDWYNNKSECYKFNHSVGIWMEGNNLNNTIYKNSIHDLGSVGIFVTESDITNISYNFIYNITDTFDYQPWPNYPDAVELDDSFNIYFGYNTITYAKRYGVSMWNIENITIEYNSFSNNMYKSNDSYPDFHIYNTTNLTFKYNNLWSRGREWPYIRGDPTGRYMLEDSFWNRNQNVTWDGENYIPGPFSNLDLITTGIGAVDATLNYWGSVDPNDCSGQCDLDERRAIPERMEDWEDYHGWGKTYFNPCYNSTTMEMIDSWKCIKNNSVDNLVFNADTTYDGDDTHGGYLWKAVDIYCQQDNDGDQYNQEQMPELAEFFLPEGATPKDAGNDGDFSNRVNPFLCHDIYGSNTNAPNFANQRDCIDVPSDCDLVFEDPNDFTYVYSNESGWNTTYYGTTFNTTTISPHNPNPPSLTANEYCKQNTDKIYPNAPEIACNGVDDDCDGQVDETMIKNQHFVCYDGNVHNGDSCWQPIINSSPLFFMGNGLTWADTMPVEICGETDDPMDENITFEEPYCMNGSIYKNKIWYERGCAVDYDDEAYCMKRLNTYTELVETCNNGCAYDDYTFEAMCITTCVDDIDGDGFISETCGGTDCHDDIIKDVNGLLGWDINPNQTEICGDWVDNDCDGIRDNEFKWVEHPYPHYERLCVDPEPIDETAMWLTMEENIVPGTNDFGDITGNTIDSRIWYDPFDLSAVDPNDCALHNSVQNTNEYEWRGRNGFMADWTDINADMFPEPHCTGENDINLKDHIATNTFTIQFNYYPMRDWNYNPDTPTHQYLNRSLISYYYDNSLTGNPSTRKRPDKFFEIGYRSDFSRVHHPDKNINDDCGEWMIQYTFEDATEFNTIMIDEWWCRQNEDNDWYNFALTYDGNILTWYMNGNMGINKSYNPPKENRMYKYEIPVSGNLSIKDGVLSLLNRPYEMQKVVDFQFRPENQTTVWSSGSIDDVRIYDFVKNEKEVKNDYYDDWHYEENFKIGNNYMKTETINVTKEMTKGWNAFSVPICPKGIWNFSIWDSNCTNTLESTWNSGQLNGYNRLLNISAAFLGHLDKFESIWYFNASSQQYVPIYIEGEYDFDEAVMPLMTGYMGYVKENFTWTMPHHSFEGDSYTNEWAETGILHEGWNLIGTPLPEYFIWRTMENNYPVDDYRWANMWEYLSYTPGGYMYYWPEYDYMGLNFTHIVYPKGIIENGDYDIYPNHFRYSDEIVPYEEYEEEQFVGSYWANVRHLSAKDGTDPYRNVNFTEAFWIYVPETQNYWYDYHTDPNEQFALIRDPPKYGFPS